MYMVIQRIGKLSVPVLGSLFGGVGGEGEGFSSIKSSGKYDKLFKLPEC